MAYISPVPLERTDSAVMSQFEFSPSPQPSPLRQAQDRPPGERE